MDNLNSDKNAPNENPDAPIPFDDSDDDMNNTNVSHSPLHLGGGGSSNAPKVESAAEAAKPVGKKPTDKIASSDRITGVKTFFTKLHAGAIDFLDGQITNWLNDNPGITIKRTNTATGDVAGKKVEPSIIVTVWY